MDPTTIKKTLKIDGMTCASCEMTIENSLKKINGVINVKAKYSNSSVYITYNPLKVDISTIKQVIRKLDYKVVVKTSVQNNVKNDSTNIKKLIGIAIILFSLYFIINNTIGFNFIPEINQSMGYGIIFVVGLLTSLHCIAMCGGINISQCMSYSFDKNVTSFGKLKPSLLYNFGRVLSYTVIGGIVGSLGSVISFSGAAKGLVAILAGSFMIIMGLNMLNIFPVLRKFNLRLPKFSGNSIYENKSKRGPFYIGLFNGLMPCGPLQSMQLYALGTGSFVSGAISMFMFSIGTVPLMFGFGAISSILSKNFTKKIMKVSAMLVMVLGIIMVNRGLSLSGVSIGYAKTNTSNVAKVQGDIQIITTKIESGSYTPFIVQKGIPVKWIIEVDSQDLNGCNNPITIPKHNIQKTLLPGENIIEFTPQEEGNIVYTCWMGMIRSNIKVVKDINNLSNEEIQPIDDYIINEGNGSSGSCCSNESYSTEFDDGKIPVSEVAISEIINDVQYVSIDVNDYGFSPALVIIEKGIQTKWVINGESLNSCNDKLTFPAYDASIELKQGENLIEFVPENDFYFSCWMGMLNGYVKVVDDLEQINLEEIKEEIKEFEAPTGGGCCG